MLYEEDRLLKSDKHNIYHPKTRANNEYPLGQNLLATAYLVALAWGFDRG